MNTDLLTDFKLAIESVSEVYFFAGFLTGFFVCVFNRYAQAPRPLGLGRAAIELGGVNL